MATLHISQSAKSSIDLIVYCLFFLGLCLITFKFGPLLSSRGARLQVRTWCVAKPSVDNKTLQESIDYACNYVNCSIVKVGGLCYNPATLINHASVIMNLYHKSTGASLKNCDFNNSGMILITDPSYDSCRYP